ncbi:MAG: NAD-dependent protein deacylase [Myxococcota bacterium]
MTDELEASIAASIAILSKARSALFITGAGISADSGVPTYRGQNGLYTGRTTEDGLSMEEVLTGSMMAVHPERTWKYLAEMEVSARGAKPSPGHLAIAALEAKIPRLVVLTQNVDGLHREAGSRRVIEIHGAVRRLACMGCGARRQVADYQGLEIPPRCRACGAIERPEVVLFEEALPSAAVNELMDELETGFEAVISVGTTSLFPYIAGPVIEAAEAGVPTIEINPGSTAISEVVDVRVRTTAAIALDRIWRGVQ